MKTAIRIYEKVSFLVFSALFFLVAGCASDRSIRIGDTAARAIAKDRTIPGKFVSGACEPYALALRARFSAAGIWSEVVGYDWQNVPRRGQPASGGHAAVLYLDGGRLYVQDNQHWLPTWVSGSADEAIAQFSGPDTFVRHVHKVP